MNVMKLVFSTESSQHSSFNDKNGNSLTLQYYHANN